MMLYTCNTLGAEFRPWFSEEASVYRTILLFSQWHSTRSWQSMAWCYKEQPMSGVKKPFSGPDFRI